MSGNDNNFNIDVATNTCIDLLESAKLQLQQYNETIKKYNDTISQIMIELEKKNLTEQLEQTTQILNPHINLININNAVNPIPDDAEIISHKDVKQSSDYIIVSEIPKLSPSQNNENTLNSSYYDEFIELSTDVGKVTNTTSDISTNTTDDIKESDIECNEDGEYSEECEYDAYDVEVGSPTRNEKGTGNNKNKEKYTSKGVRRIESRMKK